MDIFNLASSSEGNCYVLYDGSSYLLLEAGINYKDIVSKLNQLNLIITDFSGCLISHSHNDHAKAIVDVSRFIAVYSAFETLKAKGCNYNGHEVKSAQRVSIGSYSVVPFATEHDCDGSLGFIIKSKATGETLLFMTDTKYIIFDLKQWHFDYVMIECNYNDDILEQQMNAGLIPDGLSKRLLNSHMSLKTCIKTLQSFDLSKTQEIYLIHLSDARSDENVMRETVIKNFGIPVRVCQKNGGIK